jgi:hypothetical protein
MTGPEAPVISHVFGGGASESILNPIVVVAMVVVMVLMMVLPRKYVIVPFLFFIFLVPIGQQVYLLGVHWFLYRLVVLVGLARIIRSKFWQAKKVFAGGFSIVDWAFLGFVAFQAICTILQYMQVQALVNQVGFLIDFLGAYFLLRYFVRDREDIHTAIKCLAVLSAIIGFFMIREQLTLQNAFGLLGGVRSVPEIRVGKVRSQGVFQHALMAGSFAAALPPLFILLWKDAKEKILAVVGMLGCTAMAITCQSSTPLLAYVAGLFAVCLWPIRRNMKAVRWGIVAALVGLAMVMKAPVWFVLTHIDLTGGSSGYHRAELIDQFIRHFSNWWLIGTRDAGTWGYDLWDTQNEYVNAGETGGLAAFICFLVMIVACCSQIGKNRKAASGKRREEWVFWLIGASLFAHLVSFFGVNYFDQVRVAWFLLVSMILASTSIVAASQIKVIERPPVLEEPEVEYAPVGQRLLTL